MNVSHDVVQAAAVRALQAMRSDHREVAACHCPEMILFSVGLRIT